VLIRNGKIVGKIKAIQPISLIKAIIF